MTGGRTDGLSGAPPRPRRFRPPVSWHPEPEWPHEGDLQRGAERRSDGRIEADLAEELGFQLGSQHEYGRVSGIRGPELQQVRHLDLQIGRASGRERV